MSASRIVMAPEGTMMVHQANAVAGGRAADFRKMADILEAENANLVAIYSKRTGKSPDEIAALLEAETWMNAEEAVKAGFADEVLGEPKPRPRAEDTLVIEAHRRVEDAVRALRLAAMQAETLRIRSLRNAASRVATPGQPGTPAVQSQDTENTR